jgi:hypothetical protein
MSGVYVDGYLSKDESGNHQDRMKPEPFKIR